MLIDQYLTQTFYKYNIIGTHNLLKCSHQLINEPNYNKDNFRFHHISTDVVYGDLEDGDFLQKIPVTNHPLLIQHQRLVQII